MACLRKILSSMILCFVVFFAMNKSAQALQNEVIWLYAGSTGWGFNHAGYSDGFLWGNSDRHPYGGIYGGMHEVLCGEYGAAIWWNNCGSNEAIWLTDWFEWPSFQTNSIFASYGNPPYHEWNEPNNPINNIDTAYTILRDNQSRIEIRMDFELVDLGEIGYSPLTFVVDNEVAYVKSERWVLLMTYSSRP